jgi:hippurate hydrolase
MFHAGEVSNVIPDTATLTGTIRDFDAAVFATIDQRLRAVVNSTCQAFGATADVTITVGTDARRGPACIPL